MEKEMLEEVAEKIISDMGWVWENTESSARMVARHCAKSQERMYSEEEVIGLCMSAYNQATKDGSEAWLGTFDKWFEQFKKK